MTGHPHAWRTEQEGILASEAYGLRLVVLPPKEKPGVARFVVTDAASGRILGSGSKDDTRDAMKAAAAMALRSAPAVGPER